MKHFSMFTGNEKLVATKAKKKALESQIKEVDSRIVQLQTSALSEPLVDENCEFKLPPGKTLCVQQSNIVKIGGFRLKKVFEYL